jgi:predicted TPR repeat methyltransferase
LVLTSFCQAIKLDSKNHEAIKNAVQILYDLGRLEEALEIITEHVKQQPNDAIAKHMLASFGGMDVPERADDLYVKQVFDAF